MKGGEQKSSTNRSYSFGTLRLEKQTGVLYAGAELVPLPPKVIQTLLVLIENQGRVVTKQALLDSVWPDAFVEEGNLHHNISVLRRVLRSKGESAARIETIPKCGYRLVADLAVLTGAVGQQGGGAGSPTEPQAVEQPDPAGAWRPRRWLFAAAVAAAGCAVAGVLLFGSRIPARADANPAALLNSIAVLPFSNLTSDPQMDYLGDGLTDELIHALTRVPSLRVVGRTSSFQFKGKPVDLRQVGAQLQTRMVLEGSVRKDSGRLRITAQLVDASTGLYIWSERFDRRFDDLFAVQDEICQSTVNAIRLRLSGPAGAYRLAQRKPNLEVYTLYLRGLKEWNRRNREGVKAGQAFFEHAVALDANYAPAWAGLADTLVHSGVWGILPPVEAFSKAKAAALRAIELDDQLASPHTALGYVQGWYERNHNAAEASFRRAIDLDPSYSWGRQRLGSYLSARGRHEEAIREYQRVLEVDPISPAASSGLALAYFWARQYDRTIDQCARTRELDPQFPLTYYYLAHALEQKRKYEEAIAAMETGTRLWGSTDGLMLAELYAAAPGHSGQARERLEKIRTRIGGNSVEPYQMALIYAAMGNRDEAFSWLDRSSHQGDVWFLYANVDPRLDPLRSDRRFSQVRRQLDAQ